MAENNHQVLPPKLTGHPRALLKVEVYVLYLTDAQGNQTPTPRYVIHELV